MASPEGFLERWSRLKRERDSVREEPAPPTPEPEEAVDPASLPDPASLGPGDDVSAFLKKGVSDELKRTALRTAWASDPAIAGFRGFADYDWDFNEPGYGWLGNAADAVAAAGRAIESMAPGEPAPVEEASRDASPDETPAA